VNKKLIIPVATFALVGIGMFTSQQVFAEDSTNTKSPMNALVAKIASKFNLNVSDVQTVFDEDKKERETEREADYEKRLTQLVTDGKITEAQKQLIIAKHKEMREKRQAEMQSMQGKTEEERKVLMEAKKTKMETEKTEFESWAKQNGIDEKYLMGMHDGFGQRGPGGMGMTPKEK